MNHFCNSSLSGLFITSCGAVINNNINLRSITTTIEWLLCNLREIVIVALKALLRSWRNGVDRKTEFQWKFLPVGAVVEERADDACGKLAGAGCVRSLPDFAAVSASTEEVSHPDQICDEVSLFFYRQWLFWLRVLQPGAYFPVSHIDSLHQTLF